MARNDNSTYIELQISRDKNCTEIDKLWLDKLRELPDTDRFNLDGLICTLVYSRGKEWLEAFRMIVQCAEIARDVE